MGSDSPSPWLRSSRLRLPAAVHAGGIPFASFTTGSGTPFTFTNNGAGAGSGVGTLGAGTNTINFAFNADTGLSTLYYTATVSFTGTTTATTSPVNNGYTDQPINGATTDTITFTDVNSGHTLLAVTYTGDLYTKTGAGTASTPYISAPDGGTVTYSSYYLSPSFIAGPSSFLLFLPASGDLSINANGLLNSFSSTSSSFGVFSTAIPQPASVAMFGTGLAAVAFLAFRRHRMTKLTPSIA